MADDLYYFNDSMSSNMTLEDCSNDYCLPDADYMDMIFEHLYPTTFEWVLIFMHSVTFVVGLVGNALVCVAVYKNRLMRNVTNYFIVNLAVADFMVILFCLPPTVVWDITETWFLGTALCKIVLYFQVLKVVLVMPAHGSWIHGIITDP
ncbi:hypothetical protein V9T40_014437 [Parthenolecanium corni]|uniref:G-protein coupled receptors family 1 profile domain-containing protein n=1 Tax=Parthenolecanium corni TaxID=536013 RepID=A0AAN9XXH9_9HEMI